jgi:hypothetical protein
MGEGRGGVGRRAFKGGAQDFRRGGRAAVAAWCRLAARAEQPRLPNPARRPWRPPPHPTPAPDVARHHAQQPQRAGPVLAQRPRRMVARKLGGERLLLGGQQEARAGDGARQEGKDAQAQHNRGEALDHEQPLGVGKGGGRDVGTGPAAARGDPRWAEVAMRLPGPSAPFTGGSQAPGPHLPALEAADAVHRQQAGRQRGAQHLSQHGANGEVCKGPSNPAGREGGGGGGKG